jgi:predicted unusual protein kinase regulating ubiquinone biosynthesis (AarF/ABC1/UbiB family)
VPRISCESSGRRNSATARSPVDVHQGHHVSGSGKYCFANAGAATSMSENYQKYIHTNVQNRIELNQKRGISQMNNMNEMNEMNASEQFHYDPNNLLESLIEKLNLKNDAALSRALEVAPPLISKIRHRRLPVGASLLIRMHEVSALSIQDLRHLMGDRRNKFRISDKQFKPKEALVQQ